MLANKDQERKPERVKKGENSGKEWKRVHESRIFFIREEECGTKRKKKTVEWRTEMKRLNE